jgi:sugar phosphate isomerase/epimerase
MQNRRQFLKHSALMAAGTMVAPQLISSCNMSGSKNIGLQLYSLRDMVREDGIQAVLQTVSEIGYKNLETAGYGDGKIYGLEPDDFRKRVDDLGMKCTSAHLGQNFSRETESEVMLWWDKAIEVHLKAGLKYLVQPSMPVHADSEIEKLQMYCEYFNMVGKKCKEAGLAFGFHNHAGEFKKIGDHVIYDYLINNTDPEYFMLQLDVYWCHEGGSDPVEYLKNYPDRIRLTHIKDEKEIGASGKMDFEAIFKQMYANKIEDWYVEVERYTNDNPVASVRESFEYLEQAEYVR